MNTPKAVFLTVLVLTLSQTNAAWSFSSHVSKDTAPTAAAVVSGKVWIVRADGAQSCGIKAGQTIESVTGNLKNAGITVFESRKGSDGKMHAAVCGAPAGSVNAFLIPESDLPKALALGFTSAPKNFSGK